MTKTPKQRREAAELYAKAARLLEENQDYGSEYSCDRIGEACGMWQGPFPTSDRTRRLYGNLKASYEAMFRPEEDNVYWGRLWGDDAHECRILALCFMAAISERP